MGMHRDWQRRWCCCTYAAIILDSGKARFHLSEMNDLLMNKTKSIQTGHADPRTRYIHACLNKAETGMLKILQNGHKKQTKHSV